MVEIVPNLNDKQDFAQSRQDSGPGQQLADARQRAGLPIEVISAKLHIAPLVVERLERDDYQSLPPPTFVRGYLRNYANLMGLDPEKILALHTRMTGGAAAREVMIKRTSKGDDAANKKKGGFWLFFLLLLAVVAGAVWAANYWGISLQDFVQMSSGETTNAAAQQPQERQAISELIPTEQDRVVPQVVAGGEISLPAAQETTLKPANGQRVNDTNNTPENEPEPTISDADETEQSPLSISTQSVSISTSETVLTAGMGMQTSQAVLPSPADLGRSVLVLRFRGRSWVRVVDSQGKRLIGGEVTGPAVRELVGVPPFSVRLGNSGAVDIEHNGIPVDFSPRRAGLVAEFVIDTTAI